MYLSGEDLHVSAIPIVHNQQDLAVKQYSAHKARGAAVSFSSSWCLPLRLCRLYPQVKSQGVRRTFLCRPSQLFHNQVTGTSMNSSLKQQNSLWQWWNFFNRKTLLFLKLGLFTCASATFCSHLPRDWLQHNKYLCCPFTLLYSYVPQLSRRQGRAIRSKTAKRNEQLLQ